MDNEYFPEFQYRCAVGDIVAPQSKIKLYHNLLVVSLNNKLCVHDHLTKEFLLEVTENKMQKICAFDVFKAGDELFFAVGYENGLIKIFKNTGIEIKENKKSIRYEMHKNKFGETNDNIFFESRENQTPNDSNLEKSKNTSDRGIFYDPMSFESQDKKDIVIGIVNNDVEISKQFRPHSKRVTEIYMDSNLMLSSSADGTLIKYDFLSDQIKFYHTGGAKIKGFKVYGDKIFVSCTDNTIKIWQVDYENSVDFVLFPDEIFNFIIVRSCLVVFLCNGLSEMYFLNEKNRKPFNTFKKLLHVTNHGNDVCILSKGKFSIFKAVDKSKTSNPIQIEKEKSEMEMENLENEIQTQKNANSKANFEGNISGHEANNEDILFEKDNSKINTTFDLVLQNFLSEKVDEKFFDFVVKDTENIFFASKSNTIETYNLTTKKITYKTTYHETEINDIVTFKDQIASVSDECAIIWNVGTQLERLLKFSFREKSLCSAGFGNYIAIGFANKIVFYDIRTSDEVFTLNEYCKNLDICGNYMVVSYENACKIYKIFANEGVAHFSDQKINDGNKKSSNRACNDKKNVFEGNNDNLSHNQSSYPDEKNYDITSDKSNDLNIYDKNNETVKKGTEISSDIMAENRGCLYDNESNNSSYNTDFGSTSNINAEYDIQNNNTHEGTKICLKFESAIKCEGTVLTLKISPDSKILAVSVLDDNSAYLYNLKTFEMSLKLYGHSLPVRNIQFSPSSQTILTCGSDKLVKLWGTEFGECRKSFIGDCWNTTFVNNIGFLFCDNTVKYYKKHDLIKQYKGYDLKIIKYFGNHLVCSTKYGLRLYKTSDYEVVEGEDSSEVEDEIIKENKIGNVAQFELFLNEIDQLHEEGSTEYSNLRTILIDIDMAEIEKYIYLLSSEQVKLLLDCVFTLKDINLIVCARYVIPIVKIHGHLFETDENVYKKYLEVREAMGNLKNELGICYAALRYL
ncbi:hypothetical protein EDEG_02834 [Edhazardia aedis USNM 41457]|uniref:Uncharacterized protein n=1 Tax=Edhazardia aedis (strain USNM 41457) TaxID=1003232 RepID=J9D4N8_EDHAE|nr:hypothetical protein EDEG_02834 [Edhazardia aedis USNM 41457]|eukprot:EJW02771.1 hypothetical protein EDEG_02834 [Edhazardia aedis USNM 41457]